MVKLSTSEKENYLNELIELLKIPSISADSAYAKDVKKAAQWVADALTNAGADQVKVIPTKGYPIVYGEKIIDPALPTVLVYGHYDVQPPDPLDLWDSPAFDPIIKKTALHPEGAIFARGACDDKGQMYMHIKAFEWMMKNDALSCNVKFMIEGEEEVGSDNLETFVHEYKRKLTSDVILISDTGMIANTQPSITTGLRGLTYMEVTLTGPNRDLHSGLYGGAVANPINILAKMIAQLQDEKNKITIPGFYDKVRTVSDEERKEMAKAPFDLNEYIRSIDLADIHGEDGYSTSERQSIRPTLDVNGIWGGYTGEGAKTVIPSKAHAKISMRLVPDQDWEEIAQLFEQHFRAIAPKSVTVEVIAHHGGEPYVTPIDNIGYLAAHKAYTTTFGVEPFPQRGGGSIPIVPLFEKILGVKSVLMGFGLDSDAIHSPNEHFGLFNFYKGIQTIPLFYRHFAELSK